MRIKFQADANLDGRIARGLRRVSPEVDIRTAAEAGLEFLWCAAAVGWRDGSVAGSTVGQLSAWRLHENILPTPRGERPASARYRAGESDTGHKQIRTRWPPKPAR